MANRGRQTFNKRLKEQQRKEKQQEKFARKMQKKVDGPTPEDDSADLSPLDFIPDDDAEAEPESFTEVSGRSVTGSGD